MKRAVQMQSPMDGASQFHLVESENRRLSPEMKKERMSEQALNLEIVENRFR